MKTYINKYGYEQERPHDTRRISANTAAHLGGEIDFVIAYWNKMMHGSEDKLIPTPKCKEYLFMCERYYARMIENTTGTARLKMIGKLKAFYVKWAAIIEWDWQS